MLESHVINDLLIEFKKYLETEEGKGHLHYLKVKEPKETKEVLERLKSLPKDSKEFVDLTLYGLLPNKNTKYAKRVSIAPSFMNIKKFFAKFNYTENDWMKLSNLIYDLTLGFQQNPSNLESLIRNFIGDKLSKGIQCGSLSPVFFALNPDYPIVNNREIKTYKALTFLVLGEIDELSQRLENYLPNTEKIKKLTEALGRKFNFEMINDMAVFDLFCYWYDEHKEEAMGEKVAKATLEKEKMITPIDEKHMNSFFKSMVCSDPQPFFVAMGGTRDLKKLDDEGKIVYNTEFQRGEVWDEHRKQKLIDSMLRGYSINTIFLRQLPDGRYECLDGQQRLKTILKEFLRNQLRISPKITPEFNRETSFDDLPEPLKNKIRIYQVWALILHTDDDEETCRIFLRLQEGLPLNSAEKLNAMMGFLRSEVSEFTKHPFVERLGIKDYRFARRYILAQVFLLTLRNQISDIKFRHLQEIYSTYREVKPSQMVTNTVKKVLNFLEKEFEEDAQIIRFKADFISLYLLAKHLIDNYALSSSHVGLKDFFMDFAIRVGKVESSEVDEEAPYYDYKTYRKTSADSRTSIQRRFDIMTPKFLEYNPRLPPKDPNRNLDYWERLAVYRRDQGVCQLKIAKDCKPKTLFEDGTVDHKIPHSKGGTTTVENGQWACIPCNLKKSGKLN